ncbi:Dihydroorotase [wastewater metagenome]|uniref:dihydroorotase n=2 Tax=unclassified sequences TaxID=12908 RepID=A0A5B8R7K9_9ZZZZ|nr:dihydroorotase [uncultured organism]
METITLTRPDDWHLHLRDGDVLADVVPASARQFGRAIIMPNLTPPVTDAGKAAAYRERILRHIPPGSGFTPLMTLYLTDNTTPADIEAAAASGIVHAVKLYPAGATTNSDSGVTDLDRCDDALAAMAEAGLPLLVHGEVTTPGVDIFDRERAFLGERLAPLIGRHPRLRVVLEHVTTAAGIEFVRQGPDRLGATLTAHHLLLNRNDLLVGGIRPHHYCLPILKRERDREALLEAATSGDPRFFLGTDSAPHPRTAKENACGCAGVYSSPFAMALYAEAFEAVGALDRLEGFASHHGADFYGLPRNDSRIRLVREDTPVPATLPLAGGEIVPLRAGATVAWRVEDADDAG